MILDAAIVIAAAALGAVMWSRPLRKGRTWRAMITPLASIIGSGFLVLGPILNHAYGRYAPAAMLALCLVAWGFGAAIRSNIAAIEEGGESRIERGAESLASALLGFAYTISVAYYLNLFGAFALSLTPLADPTNARLMTTAVYLAIAAAGWGRGFRMLEAMEYASVSLKIAIIGGLFVGLSSFAWGKLQAGALIFAAPDITGWAALTLGFGLIVTVQGFETSRYLGATYEAGTRIRSMRLAQTLATAIYLVYIVLIAYTFRPDEVALTETAIVDMMRAAAPILPALLVAAALAAQFSAAVADTGGSGGLIAEVSGGRVTPKQAYILVLGIGIALTWSADVFEIISYASRAFAAYYAVQAAIAAWRGWHRSGGRGRTALFAGLALLGVAITVFGEPVE